MPNKKKIESKGAGGQAVMSVEEKEHAVSLNEKEESAGTLQR